MALSSALGCGSRGNSCTPHRCVYIYIYLIYIYMYVNMASMADIAGIAAVGGVVNVVGVVGVVCSYSCTTSRRYLVFGRHLKRHGYDNHVRSTCTCS